MPENEIITMLASLAAESRSEAAKNSRQQLTNDDFRKLLMTPRGPSTTSMPTPSLNSVKVEKTPAKDNKHDLRKKKKSFYASLKKQEDDKMAELAEKYRDRAKERREGGNPDYQADDPISTMAGYRAVAPDAKSGLDAAERRRQLIQESKFLGGDMEHTHLVKGLDYALLQKVRSEITSKEKEEDDLDDLANMKPKAEKAEEEPCQIEFHSSFAKNIYRTAFRNQLPERNELFLPGRLAYVIELEDEFAESDIPTTLIRSKADCPSIESQTTLTTNDIVINKLTQILTYLRQGARANKKMKRKDKEKVKEDDKPPKLTDESIYGDIGDYVPNSSKSNESGYDKKDKKKKREYFDKSGQDDYRHDSEFSRMWGDMKHDKDSMTTLVQEATMGLPVLPRKEDLKSRSSKILTKLQEPDSYAECYPGAPETADAIDDSDDDVDYTKMDMGNKKGPVGRWDFDSQEEYSHYMNQKEALPKAAFQYGVKMADGRKTRRTAGKKDEKAELDREWQKISQIIAKRKTTEEDRGEPDYKVPRY